MFSSKPTHYLGIDIGNTSIKMVELEQRKKNLNLATYGFANNLNIPIENWHKDYQYIAKIIKKIKKNAKIKSQSAVLSLPAFAVFASVLNLSNINKKNLQIVINNEAKKIIPLPLEEMILDWKVIDKIDFKKGEAKILLTGAPRVLVKKYIQILKKADISLLSLETETFSLIRSLLGKDRSTNMIVKIGAMYTDITIISNGLPMFSHSLDVAGDNLDQIFQNYMKIDLFQAKKFKEDLSLANLDSQNSEMLEIITKTINPIVSKIQYAIALFLKKYNLGTEKIILTGGSALLPSLVNYLENKLNKKVIIGDPWARVNFNEAIKLKLEEVGPQMAVASGLALR